jgi:hypothetical protein
VTSQHNAKGAPHPLHLARRRRSHARFPPAPLARLRNIIAKLALHVPGGAVFADEIIAPDTVRRVIVAADHGAPDVGRVLPHQLREVAVLQREARFAVVVLGLLAGPGVDGEGGVLEVRREVFAVGSAL